MATAALEATETTTSKHLSSVLLALVVCCFWAILGMSFTLPEREDFNVAGKADWVGRLKLLARVGSFGVLVLVCLVSVRMERFKKALKLHLPFLLFFGFAVASSRWSSLPSVSMVQSFSLAVVLMISICIATLADSPKKIGWVWASLNVLLLGRALAMFLIEVLTGDGISRDNTSYWHATDGADTCGLGLVVLIGSHFLLGNKISKLLLIPGVLIYAALFVVVQNRFIMVLDPLIVLMILVLAARRKIIFGIIAAVAFVGPLVLIADGYYGTLSEVTGATARFADRHDSDSVGSFSGRDEMWALILEEFKYSPIIGHGYMVTSRKGEFECWYETRNHDAHNQMLHVLVTTGFVGLGLFLLALTVPLKLIWKHLLRRSESGKSARLIGFVFAWLFLWGLLNVSFSGYINASFITFYAVLGLAIAQFGISNNESSSDTSLTRSANPKRLSSNDASTQLGRASNSA